MGSRKADENVPDQDLDSTLESNFDDVKTDTAEPDSKNNFSSVYPTGT